MSRRVHFASRRAATITTNTEPVRLPIRRKRDVAMFVPLIPLAVCIALLILCFIVETQ